MKNLVWLITAICIIAFTYTFCEANSSPEVNIWFMTNWLVQLNYSKTWLVPGKTYSFDVKFENAWWDSANIQIWFVDGAITNDKFRSKSCLSEWQWEKLWKYITWASIVHIPAKSTVVETYTLNLPKNYKYHWDIPWCITISTLDAESDAGTFKIVTRKANFIDINVVPVDTVPPYIVSYSIEDWATNISTDTVITIVFSETMDKQNVRNAISMNWSYVLDWNEDDTQIFIRPVGSFSYNTEYTLTIWTGASDYYLNELTWWLTIHFTTEEYIEPEPEHIWYSGWGSHNTIKPQKDNCPNWDFSNSLFDGSCWDYNEFEEWHWTADWEWCSTKWSIYWAELNWAYKYACNLKITTMSTIQESDIMGPLLRKHLAKMISEFAVKTVWTPIDYNKTCIFNDMDEESEEMKYYAQLSCQLWLMGLNSDWVTVKDSFNPNEYVTRAQFWTVLSRLLWWTTYAPEKSNELYYSRHLEALRRNAIMTEIYGKRPYSVELRWRVMLMLQRVDENNLVSNISSDNWTYIDEWHINISINNDDHSIYHTNKDLVTLKGQIDKNQYIKEIHVTHSDSLWVWQCNNYKLQKYIPWESEFVFYAYRWYNTLTINDINEYLFEFYDNNWEIISKSIIILDHNYNYNN